MSKAAVNAGLEAAGITEYERNHSYGWGKFDVMSGIGAPPKVAQYAIQIALTLIGQGKAREIEAIFNRGDLNANNTACDSLAKLERSMKARANKTPANSALSGGMVGGVGFNFPTAPPTPKGNGPWMPAKKP